MGDPHEAALRLGSACKGPGDAACRFSRRKSLSEPQVMGSGTFEVMKTPVRRRKCSVLGASTYRRRRRNLFSRCHGSDRLRDMLEQPLELSKVYDVVTGALATPAMQRAGTKTNQHLYFSLLTYKEPRGVRTLDIECLDQETRDQMRCP